MLNMLDIKKLRPNFKLNLRQLLEDDNLRWPTLASYGIDRNLYSYMENQVMEKYDKPYLRKHHDRSHIYNVLANAIILLEIQFDLRTQYYAKELVGKGPETLVHKDQVIEIIEADFKRDMNILYAAVCLHDIGLNLGMVNIIKNLSSIKASKNPIDINLADHMATNTISIRQQHHEAGYLLAKYHYAPVLKTYGFIDAEVNIIADAILKHRASDLHNTPENEIEKVLCQADRCYYFTTPYEVFERSFYSKLATNINNLQQVKIDSLDHVREKNGEDGYAYVKTVTYGYPDNKGFIDYRQNMIDTLLDNDKIIEIYRNIINNYTDKILDSNSTEHEIAIEFARKNIKDEKEIVCPNCGKVVKYQDKDKIYDDYNEMRINCPYCFDHIYLD